MICTRSWQFRRCNRGDPVWQSSKWSKWEKLRCRWRYCLFKGLHSKRNYKIMIFYRTNTYAKTWRKIMVMKVVSAIILMLMFFHLRTSKFSSWSPYILFKGFWTFWITGGFYTGRGPGRGSFMNPPLLSSSSSRKGFSLMRILGFPPNLPCPSPSSGKGLCWSAFPNGSLLF